MCNCIKNIEKKLTEKMKEQYPDFEVIEDVSFQNVSYLLDSGIIVLNNPVLGRVKKGKQILKFKTSMMPSYCPFCGEKLQLTGACRSP